MEILNIENADELTRLRAKVKEQEQQIELLNGTVVSLLKTQDTDELDDFDAEAYFRGKAREYVKRKAVDWTVCGMCISTIIYLVALIWANVL